MIYLKGSYLENHSAYQLINLWYDVGRFFRYFSASRVVGSTCANLQKISQNFLKISFTSLSLPLKLKLISWFALKHVKQTVYPSNLDTARLRNYLYRFTAVLVTPQQRMFTKTLFLLSNLFTNFVEFNEFRKGYDKIISTI